MKIFSIDSPLMQFLSKVADFMLLNLMFLAFCIPVFTIGAAKTALYRVFILQSNGDEESVIRLFYAAFKKNFKQGTFTELVLLLPTALVCGDIYLLYSGATGESALLVWLCLIPGALLLMLFAYVYPLTAQFNNTVGQNIKNSLLLSIANFPISALAVLLNASPVIILLVSRSFFVKTAVIWLLLGFAVVAYINEKLLHRVFRRFIPDDGGESNISE